MMPIQLTGIEELNKAFMAFLEAHEKWEAMLLNDDGANLADYMDDEQMDAFMEVQRLRNEAKRLAEQV